MKGQDHRQALTDDRSSAGAKSQRGERRGRRGMEGGGSGGSDTEGGQRRFER